jgi:hypothetical protein
MKTFIVTIAAFLGGIAYGKLFGEHCWDPEVWHIVMMVGFAVMAGLVLEGMERSYWRNKIRQAYLEGRIGQNWYARHERRIYG